MKYIDTAHHQWYAICMADNGTRARGACAGCNQCHCPTERTPVPWNIEQRRKVQEHPCYSEQAAHAFGRMHLPVAPRCNLQCNYCVRDFDCVNESRPGVTSRVLTPDEALEKVDEVLARHPFVKVIAVAGPGEPLYNEHTFETLALVRRKYPDLHLCLSTNGLLLPEKLAAVHELGVGNLTVTMNAVDPAVGERVYSWVRYQGETLTGREAAEVLLRQQLEGIAGAVRLGILVKVNSVMVPGVNDEHMPQIAQEARRLGVYIQNIMPLIPQYKFAHLPAPTESQWREVRQLCCSIIRQMQHCRRCRSDAVGLLCQDLSRHVYQTTA